MYALNRSESEKYASLPERATSSGSSFPFISWTSRKLPSPHKYFVTLCLWIQLVWHWHYRSAAIASVPFTAGKTSDELPENIETNFRTSRTMYGQWFRTSVGQNSVNVVDSCLTLTTNICEVRPYTWNPQEFSVAILRISSVIKPIISETRTYMGEVWKGTISVLSQCSIMIVGRFFWRQSMYFKVVE